MAVTASDNRPSSTSRWSPGRASREVLVRGGHPIVAAAAVFDGDADLLTGFPCGGSVREAAKADLGPLQVGQDAHRSPRGVGSGAHPLVVGAVVGVITVAEIEPRHIHSGCHECGDSFIAGCRGTQRADDLGSSGRCRCRCFCAEQRGVGGDVTNGDGSSKCGRFL
jgi:hypothetical protein